MRALLILSLAALVISTFGGKFYGPKITRKNGGFLGAKGRQTTVNKMKCEDENKYITMNYGSRNTKDNKDKLFKKVDSQAESSKVVQLFKKLLDNYKPKTGVKEDRTSAEIREEDAFMTEVFKSKPFTALYNDLKSAGHPWTSSRSTWEKNVKFIWLDTYWRNRAPDSSGFEHVFIGEYKNYKGKSVTGLHSWIAMNEYEKKGKLNYLTTKDSPRKMIGSVSFKMEGYEKPKGSFLVGTTPACELALYTMCFLDVGREGDDCKVNVNGCDINVKTYEKKYKSSTWVATAFPQAERSCPTS